METHIASKRKAGNEQVASLLVVANLLQRLSTRSPSVRLPRPPRARSSSRSTTSAPGAAALVAVERGRLQPRHYPSSTPLQFSCPALHSSCQILASQLPRRMNLRPQLTTTRDLETFGNTLQCHNRLCAKFTGGSCSAFPASAAGQSFRTDRNQSSKVPCLLIKWFTASDIEITTRISDAKTMVTG